MIKTNNKYKPHLMRAKKKNKIEELATKNAKVEGVKLKPFYSFKDLQEELSKKVSFTPEELILAEEFLKDTNYYRFSIYPKLLPTGRKNSFSDALDLYNFDDFLRCNLYEFTSYLENKLKARLVTFLGDNYTEDNYYVSQCYLDLNLYANEKWGKDIIATFISRIKNSKSQAMLHHIRNRNEYVPLWVLIEELTFGEFETFFTQIHASHIRFFVQTVYENPQYKKPFNGWLSVIRELRNKISHHSRLYGSNFTKAPAILRKDKPIFYPELSNRNSLIHTLMSAFYVIHKLMLCEKREIIDKWNCFLEQLDIRIDKLNHIIDIEKYMGFPSDWKNLLTVPTVAPSSKS